MHGKTVTFILLLTLIAGVDSLLTNCGRSDHKQKPLKQDTVLLTKHWESPIPHQIIPEGLVSISAASCGTCHEEIYKEWLQSTHAVAFQDPQFQAELNKDNIITCLNCHTPLQNQQEFIVRGFINGDYKTPWKEINPHFDKSLQLESITCATCHIRDGKVIGTIGSDKVPHKTLKDPGFLSEKLCLGCHNVVDEASPQLVCTFETGDEWNANWAKQEGKNCISCHMPSTDRSLFPGMPKRTAHFHHFPASGIPKFKDREAGRLESMEFTESTVNHKYAVRDLLNYQLKIKNSFAGHNVPTGDPERFFMIRYQWMDASGNKLKEEVHRIGEEWQWYPVAKKISDNNLKPKEERAYPFTLVLENKGTYSFRVEVTKHRMTEENARYNKILGEYPLSIEVFSKQYEISVE